MPKFLKVAGIILAIIALCCLMVVAAAAYFISTQTEIYVISFEPAQPNGEVVSFELGETKAFSDGTHTVLFTYNGDGTWFCQDTANDQICDNFSLIVGIGDETNPAGIILLGEWHEVEVEEIPAPPLNQQDA
jgi:hypothetical protein